MSHSTKSLQGETYFLSERWVWIAFSGSAFLTSILSFILEHNHSFQLAPFIFLAWSIGFIVLLFLLRKSEQIRRVCILMSIGTYLTGLSLGLIVGIPFGLVVIIGFPLWAVGGLIGIEPLILSQNNQLMIMSIGWISIGFFFFFLPTINKRLLNVLFLIALLLFTVSIKSCVMGGPPLGP
jgi:hypothetical protein